MEISECNPFVRAAQIQPAVLEGASPRIAFDHRIFLILDGEGRIHIAGTDHPLKPNDLVCFPPGTEYYFRGKMKVVVLNYDLTRAFQNQRTPKAPVPREEYDPRLRFDPTVADGFESPLFFRTDEFDRDSVLAIVSAFVSKRPYADARTSAELKRLLVGLLEKRTALPDPQDRLVEKILLFVRSNAAEITDNAFVARAFGYHPVYVASLVKERTGKTLHRTVLEERIRLACRFLRSTDSTVEQIAFDTGFSSRNHFCTVFRGIKGVTPLAYRTGKGD